MRLCKNFSKKKKLASFQFGSGSRIRIGIQIGILFNIDIHIDTYKFIYV